MYEQEPTTQPDDPDDLRVSHLVDTLGISIHEARLRLGILDDSVPSVTRAESKRLHPARYIGRRPAVGEDSEDIMTGIPTEEQVETNIRGAALARQALLDAQRLNGSYDDSIEARARRRAKEERRWL